MPKTLAQKIKESSFTDQAYMLHMQVHLEYIINQDANGFTCPMCSKYPLSEELQEGE